jgi:hypothetical protein
MDSKTTPSKIYIPTNPNNARNEENYIIKEEVENNLQWGKESAIVELLHIVEIDQHPTFKDLPIYRLKNDQHYYVDIP